MSMRPAQIRAAAAAAEAAFRALAPGNAVEQNYSRTGGRRYDSAEVDVRYREQVATFSGADRDPRDWSISTLHYALLPTDQVLAVAGLSVGNVAWCDPNALGSVLALDHDRQLAALRRRVQRGALPLHLLPARFTLTELQRACEAILGRGLDNGAFRRTIRESSDLIQLDREFARGPQRQAQLYQATGSFRF